MRRYRDWELRLTRWATGLEGRPFRWGETDCASLLCQALRVMSPDPLTTPVWADARSARRARRSVRPTDLLRAHGLATILPPYVQPGDVAVLESPRALTCGVSLGPWAMTVHRRRGIRRTALAEFAAATWFRLGAP